MRRSLFLVSRRLAVCSSSPLAGRHHRNNRSDWFCPPPEASCCAPIPKRRSSARPGDLLFAGDGLKTETGPASFLFCPAKAIDTLTRFGEVRFGSQAAESEIRQNLRNQTRRALALCRKLSASPWPASSIMA